MSRVVTDDDEVVEVDKGGPWTKSSEAIFVDIVDEEVKKYHSRLNGSFTKPAWKRMREKLIAKTSYQYTELQVKNKFNQLRLLHTKIVKLCKQSGV